MKKIFAYILLGVFISSCLTVKVYKTKGKIKEEPQKPISSKTTLIRSGIIIPLINGDSTEVFFPGESRVPEIRDFTFIDEDGRVQSIAKEERSRDTLNKEIILKFRKGVSPIIIIDRVEIEEEIDVKSIDVDSIESINIYKGAKAIEMAGKKGKNGVIVIKKRN